MTTDDGNPYAAPLTAAVADDEWTRIADLSRARRLVRPPAIALIVLALIAILLDIILLANLVIGVPEMLRASPPGQGTSLIAANIGGNALMLLIHSIVLLGAVKMLRLRTYSNAITAAVVSLIPFCSPVLILGIPFGIWALCILSRSDVRAGFAENAT